MSRILTGYGFFFALTIMSGLGTPAKSPEKVVATPTTMPEIRYDRKTFEQMWNDSVTLKASKPTMYVLKPGPLNFTKQDYEKMKPMPPFPEIMLESAESESMGRNIIPNDGWRWKEAITFQIDPKFNREDQDIIFDALQELADGLPCLKFQITVLIRDIVINIPHVFIQPGNGCSSSVGRRGNGRQFMTLGDGCVHKGTVQHETLHALGINHEQSRPDRDEYVTIFRNNIEAGREHNFDRAIGWRTFGFAYDYYSI